MVKNFRPHLAKKGSGSSDMYSIDSSKLTYNLNDKYTSYQGPNFNSMQQRESYDCPVERLNNDHGFDNSSMIRSQKQDPNYPNRSGLMSKSHTIAK